MGQIGAWRFRDFPSRKERPHSAQTTSTRGPFDNDDDDTAADCVVVVVDPADADKDVDDDDNVRPFVRAFTVLACSLGNAGGQEDVAVVANPIVVVGFVVAD